MDGSINSRIYTHNPFTDIVDSNTSTVNTWIKRRGGEALNRFKNKAIQGQKRGQCLVLKRN